MSAETEERQEPAGFICGSSNSPIGSRVPLNRQLHDNGFGYCALTVQGLWGEAEPRTWATFWAFPRSVWTPTDQPPRSLRWVERKIRTWDAVWPEAKWAVSLSWPWQTEKWERQSPGMWVVTESSDRGVAG